VGSLAVYGEEKVTQTTHCSYCDEEVGTRRVRVTDTISDYRCAQCGEYVMLDGNARREQLRREEGEQFTARVRELADELEQRRSPEPRPSILDIKARLERIVEDIDAVDDRIQRETELDSS
jgi:hypothetical protein